MRLPINIRNASKEELKWYRIITNFQLTIGLLAIGLLWWHNNRAAGTYQMLETHSSDARAYTQGLEVTPGERLLMSVGNFEESGIGYLEEGVFQEVHALPDDEFGEGLTQTPSAVWQLTWKSEKAYKYSPKTLKVIDTVTYSGEGWGLAYNPSEEVIYMSDGTATIQVRHPDSFELIETFEVVDEGGEPVSQLNELEFANDGLYANIYLTNKIVKIDVNESQVITEWDFTSTVEELREEAPDINEFNGIAHIEDDRFYVTGKDYPVLYEVILNE